MFEELAGAALPALDMLLLGRLQVISNGGLQVIANAPWAARLRTLGVQGCNFSNNVLRDALPSFPRLDVLCFEQDVSLPGWVYDPDVKVVVGQATQDFKDDLPSEVLLRGAFCRLPVA